VSNAVADQTRIIYAGPITETNTENLCKLPDVDGFMVGTTSTKPVFRNIFEMVNAQVMRDFSYAEPKATKAAH